MQFCLPKLRDNLLAHHAGWKDCEKCGLCKSRSKVVLWRGYIPCELLLIGEAPGNQEDTDGFPFTGPSGQLLQRIIDEAEHLLTREWKSVVFTTPIIAFTNSVACFPANRDPLAPHKDELAACSPRLFEFVKLAQPTTIVFVGEIAKTTKATVADAYPNCHSSFDMKHPAAILRDRVKFGQHYQQAVTVMMNAMQTCEIPF